MAPQTEYSFDDRKKMIFIAYGAKNFWTSGQLP
jgi:hypothetical protein